MFYRQLLANSKQPAKVLANSKQKLANGKQVDGTLAKRKQSEEEELKALDERIARAKKEALAR